MDARQRRLHTPRLTVEYENSAFGEGRALGHWVTGAGRGHAEITAIEGYVDGERVVAIMRQFARSVEVPLAAFFVDDPVGVSAGHSLWQRVPEGRLFNFYLRGRGNDEAW